MPNRPVHVTTSGSAGLIWAYANAPANGSEVHRALEVAGGVLGGVIGGLLPDVFDPPCHPHHRSLAHGVLPVLAGTNVWAQRINEWQVSLRTQADAYAFMRATCVDPLMAALYGLLEAAVRIFCGAVAGIGAGYLTHVALDFSTPRGLPLIN